jgi:hypothetical protein
MVTGLTALTRLKTLSIRFQSSVFRFNNSDRMPPFARIVLPSLTLFGFRGNSEYLEDLVAQIDAHRLVFSRITYFNQLIFQVPQLSRFITRAENLGPAPFRHAQIGLGGGNLCGKVYINFVCEQGSPLKSYHFLQISCQGLDWQVSGMTQEKHHGPYRLARSPPPIHRRADTPGVSAVGRPRCSCVPANHRGDGRRSTASSTSTLLRGPAGRIRLQVHCRASVLQPHRNHR